MLYLNLDELPTKSLDRSITLDGKDHEMAPLTVEQFIEQTRQPVSTDPAASVEQMVLMISTVFPTIAAERLRKLPLPTLSAIMDWLNKSADEINAAGAATSVANSAAALAAQEAALLAAQAAAEPVNGEVLEPEGNV